MFKYSIIIPTHNRNKLLERAIKSVKKQSENISHEIIVISDIDDIGTDILCSQLLGKNDYYVRRGGRAGPAESRNLALKICTGNAIIFLDDDDELMDDCLENIEIARENEFPFFYFNADIITESRYASGAVEHKKIKLNLENNLNKFIYIKNQIPICNLVFPASLIKNITFSSCMKAYEDWDFLLSVFDQAMPKYLPITGSIIHQVDDDTTDRRGSSSEALGHHAILDYLFVYKKHPVTDIEIKIGRSNLMSNCGVNFGIDYM